jgi:starch synthase
LFYTDNDERAIFFAKGVVETVKKLNWVPDVIHVHGWMASLLPVYLKHYYKDEGIFEDTKIISSIYNQSFEGMLDEELIKKLAFDNLPEDAIAFYEKPTFENLMKATIFHSDAVLVASEELSSDLTKYIETSKKPFLPFEPKESFKESYVNFIKNEVL